ncbi:MAG: hypothetical protein ACR2NP_06210 [Pirellulaceae bacterium]
MSTPARLQNEDLTRVERVLGYLNFSSGAEDPSMLQSLDGVFAALDDPHEGCIAHESVHELLEEQLQLAEQNNPAFSDAEQARNAIRLTFQHVLPLYLIHHRDLLFHHSPESLFNSFFTGRIFEAVLQFGSGQVSPEETARQIIARLNDFIGHRPVAVLESQKIEPCEHEWVRPIPVYIRGAGVAHGPHRDVLECAIELLHATDPQILQEAQFDPELLDELAIDPRSFDFDHPVNKRPNHHFGQWDEHHIDNQGRYRRFVIHQVTLDALTSRITDTAELPRGELVLEAGSVLAGTILMAAGICGYGPGAHDSTVTLSNLLPRIARYRDQFYADLLSRIEDPHRHRLLTEAETRQQPFGAARQHLNRQLARYRAFQMVHVHLALIFSRMGYDQAAIRHANILPVASARMLCQLECLMYAGYQALEDGDLSLAGETLPRLFDLLQRAVGCGAIIDPWNIIGFDANYNLFEGSDNSVRDHRADELVQLMEQIFCFASQVWITSQAADRQSISDHVQKHFREVVDWWHRFAVHQVSSVESADAHEIFAATRDVASLLNQWHKTGAQSGDVQFWARHAQSFTSPRAYILAISCLIDRQDFVTSMALLIHWLNQSETMPLQQTTGSFQSLVLEWISRQRALVAAEPSSGFYLETWGHIRKFCDYIEANAGDFWNVPKFGLDTANGNATENGADGLPTATMDDDGDNLYRAAYEDMVFRESADDGFEGSVFDTGNRSEESIQAEFQRIADRLEFLQALAEYWLEAAMFVNDLTDASLDSDEHAEFLEQQSRKVGDWCQQANTNCRQIDELIKSIQRYRLPNPDGSAESLVDYDRQRLFKEMMLDHAISLRVDTTSAARLLAAVAPPQARPQGNGDEEDQEQTAWIQVLSAILGRDQEQLSRDLPTLMSLLEGKPLLYVPLSKGGDPLKIVSTRVRQCMIEQLLDSLPRLGRFTETRELIHLALMMERNQSVRQGAVTEFDELFRVGYTAMVEALIEAARRDDAESEAGDNSGGVSDESQNALFDCLEILAESMLMLWLSHSQTLRLSVLEKVRDDASWDQLVEFIDQFGDEIFTQQFLNLANIRAILHQGVETWLIHVEDENSDEIGMRFVEKISQGYPRKDAIRHLTWVLEAIIENFNEYRDYNCTTTQSDNGRLLFVLLDFLRLRYSYDRVCWNLKPVIWAHESLVRFGENSVARLWRRLLANRVNPEADKLIEKLHGLQERYSIQMATVSQRLNERFVHPMHVDRLVSLVPSAMHDADKDAALRSFEMIENYAESLTQQPIGVGFELPGWITALQQEVESSAERDWPADGSNGSGLVSDSTSDLQSLREQLEQMPRRT